MFDCSQRGNPQIKTFCRIWVFLSALNASFFIMHSDALKLIMAIDSYVLHNFMTCWEEVTSVSPFVERRHWCRGHQIYWSETLCNFMQITKPGREARFSELGLHDVGLTYREWRINTHLLTFWFLYLDKSGYFLMYEVFLIQTVPHVARKAHYYLCYLLPLPLDALAAYPW